MRMHPWGYALHITCPGPVHASMIPVLRVTCPGPAHTSVISVCREVSFFTLPHAIPVAVRPASRQQLTLD